MPQSTPVEGLLADVSVAVMAEGASPAAVEDACRRLEALAEERWFVGQGAPKGWAPLAPGSALGPRESLAAILGRATRREVFVVAPAAGTVTLPELLGLFAWPEADARLLGEAGATPAAALYRRESVQEALEQPGASGAELADFLQGLDVRRIRRDELRRA